jgi:hypothetical protein
MQWSAMRTLHEEQIMTFCSDVDLLHWEPHLFVDAAAAAQVLMSGTGNLAGTAFTIASGSLASNHIEVDQVIVLSGSVAGSFPIVTIGSTTTLALSVLYDGLYPDDGSPAVATPVDSASGLGFSIATFWPQRRVASDLLRHAAGFGPTVDPTLASQTILNPQVLRRACALGTLQMIYNALAATIPSVNVTPYSARSDVYANLFRQAMRSAKVEVDLNGDGVVDEVRPLSLLRFVRA